MHSRPNRRRECLERLDRGETEEEVAAALDVSVFTVQACKAQGWDRLIDAERLLDAIALSDDPGACGRPGIDDGAF